MTCPNALTLENIQFSWPKKMQPTLAFPQLNIAHQQHVFIKGPSGCGKSTLLGLLCGILTPQQGQVSVLGQDLSSLKQAQRDQFRADHIGYIFQQFNLLPYLSVIDNVLLPCRFSRLRKQRTLQDGPSLPQQAKQLLLRLQLPENCFDQPVNELSIGQQQRVAAARALIGKPEIIIADEPTSSLDTDNRQAFISLLMEQANQSQACLIFVSHDANLQAHFEHSVDLTQLNQATGVSA
ncbi:ABC transporter ATP-binding protein [Vibrio sp. S11_S32]|uniref:ATP-binding cassette domain-containing protein n=2 Tax=Vibrionaceae TaxID=641 RepID=A0A5Q0TG25_9VIBR|nr:MULTISPECIES: ABC transporter ATP-binding protein [Vibrio]MBD1576341.1 ABC transporter ATP-binding protein [Vibrio sp. S11_S32]